MIDFDQKQYIVLVQCDIVQQRCPGYLCEKAFHERTGGFAAYPKEKPYRLLSMTCGGCCGRAVHRKLTQFLRTIRKRESIAKEQIVVQLSSCMTNDNYHAPPCPHLDYIRTLIDRIGLDVMDATVVSNTSQQRRDKGIYNS